MYYINNFFLLIFVLHQDRLSVKLVLTAKELLRELVHDAHTLGLKVVLDVCLGRAVNVAGREESTPCSPRSKVALLLQDGLLPVINGVMGAPIISRFISLQFL